MLKLTKTFYKNADAYCECKYKYIINQGGSSSGKTFSILQILTQIALNRNIEIDICGESMPHLKRGVLRDLPKVFDQFGLNFDLMYNKSDHYVKFDNGAKVNLIALDDPGKARGARRDVLFINEANLIPYETARQLLIRTHETIFIDYNPTNAFWVHQETIPKNPDTSLLIKSTYKDNQFLSESEIAELESHRGDGNNNFWRVYGLGELGIAEGLVFENFSELEFDKNRFSRYYNGIDWGFSNDPFAFVRVAIENENLYICDEIYQTKLLNKDSAPLVSNIIGSEYVYCDCAEPKSIADYQNLGINALPCQKGAGSIESGIKHIQSYKNVYIHPSCYNTLSEFRNYEWRQDKNGDYMPVPVDAFNHAIDAIRYALNDVIGYNTIKAIKGLRL